MKKFLTISAIISLLAMFSSCDDSTSIMFTDYYACIKDEGGAATSTISTNMTESYTATYYISLVSVIMDDPVTISYEIKAGDGLKEGVNFKVINGTGNVTFDKGIFKKPLRIEYFPAKVDETKDCKLTIRLTESSNKSIGIGYPGPNRRFSEHTITIHNK